MTENRNNTNEDVMCVDSSCMEKIVTTLLDSYRQALYEYNRTIKRFGVYLKPLHIVVKKYPYGEKRLYYYFGRYWYILEKKGSNLKWIYLGKEKPFPELPDPPINPLLLIEVINERTTPNTYKCIRIDSFGAASLQIRDLILKIYRECESVKKNNNKS
jgi:hypothetical protein